MSAIEICCVPSSYSLTNRKPDIIVKRKGQQTVPFNVISVGELKGSSVNIDTSECKGQIEDYLLHLLLDQPMRQRALGFITNHKVIHVLEAQRDGDQFKFIWFIREQFDGNPQAPKALSWLLNLSLEDCGYSCPIDDKNVQVGHSLGVGSTSYVYHGVEKSSRSPVVIKIYKEEHLDSMKNEKCNLEYVKEKDVQNVPLVVECQQKALILKPVGKCLEIFKLTESDIIKLVGTLFDAHNKGMVHRDISSRNLFKTDENNVFINDWGSAVHVEEHRQNYNGVTAEASPAILDALLSRTVPPPKYNDDLHALARTLFCIQNSHSSDILPNGISFVKEIQEFWCRVSKQWKKIFDLADTADIKDHQTYKNFAELYQKCCHKQ